MKDLVLLVADKNGEGFVDYVLWGDDGRPLGLTEAKRTRNDPRIGQQQAKLYEDCLEREFGHLTQNGVMAPGLLYESPFIDLNPAGLDGLFSDPEARNIVQILGELQNHAAVG